MTSARAWGGISSLQLGLPLVWTQARRRGFTLGDVAVWMAERPARLAGLSGKGRIAAGYDADFCVFAPDESVHRRPGPAAPPAPGDAVRGPTGCGGSSGARSCAASRSTRRTRGTAAGPGGA